MIKLENVDTTLNKQPKIMAVNSKCVSKSKLDKLVINFITLGLHLFNIAESKEFQELIYGMQQGYTITSQPTAYKRMDEAAMEMQKN